MYSQKELLDQFDLRQKELHASSTTISEMQRVITQLQSVIKIFKDLFLKCRVMRY